MKGKVDALNGMLANHKYAKVGKNLIHYVEGGKGPTILFVHSWNNDWFGFVPIVKKLKGFRVVALDLPGYGQSKGGLSKYSVEIMSDVVADFIKETKIKPKVVCGLSMGAGIVVDFGARYGNLTENIIAISPPVMKKDWIGSKIYAILMNSANITFLTRKIGKLIVSNYYYGHFTAKHFNMYHYDKKIVDEFGLKDRKATKSKVLFNMSVSMTKFDAAGKLSSIKIPTKLIFGKYDKLIDLDKAKKIAEAKKFEIDFIDDAGHVVTLEKPEETARLIQEFAKK